MIEMTPILNNKDHTPLYIQLANYIKEEILAGKMKPGEKLPSKRKLADYLRLSLNTIQSAYEQLSAEGYVESKPRKGLFVTTLEDDRSLTMQVGPPNVGAKREAVLEKEKVTIDFNSGKIDLALFPYAQWRKLTVQALYEDQGDLFNIGDPQGERLLREEISSHLYASRGVRCSADQIIIGAGSQVLMGLLCLVIGKEHSYALENPGYHRTKAVLHDLGVDTVSISLDEDGVEMTPLKNSVAKVVYVTPSHQFPNGMIMPISRRMELLGWAEETGGYIIEDDYDGEYRYKGQPIPSLQGLDTNGTVIYLGTFSKSLIPSLRISYMVLPPSLLKRYQEKFTIYKQTVSRLHQDTLYRFMKEGHWQSHLNKMRTLYRKKHAALLASIKKYFGSKVEVIGENSGLHIVLKVETALTETELIERALHVGVKVYPLSIYCDGEMASGQQPSVLLGFGGLSEKEIDEGIRLLKNAWGDSPPSR
ncbi:GntR family transcriptional regulator/MocR family aminotransferase [Bacillus sp. SORGH_AS 510]|uniref:MocR-like pyridoxine biosynthesis transcription factor PdxR n=1 Tax=Bacillus sp. SORGH_AS_0510 TaxID=3041771 RepID=UPI00277F2C6B|nr:PLP-dependent aminotransferase family protein [Bacillus sp. SORGH_AS_0510]MDQ1143690.1 GntR family transcriptional regulator/MocR family aminotransferase [Bacillus sp. SORGH_AS_0510]